MPYRSRLALAALLSLSCSLARVALPRPTPTLSPPTSTPKPTPIPPVYLPPQCAGTPVATIPAATTMALPTIGVAGNPEIDAETQLAVLEDLRSAVETNYVVPEAVSEDWRARVDATRAAIEAGLATDAFYTRMRELVSALGDDHSYFQTPA